MFQPDAVLVGVVEECLDFSQRDGFGDRVEPTADENGLQLNPSGGILIEGLVRVEFGHVPSDAGQNCLSASYRRSQSILIGARR